MAEPEMQIPEPWVEAIRLVHPMSNPEARAILRAVLPLALAPARDVLDQVDACMSIVEPRSDKEEYARILAEARKARDEIVKVIGG